MANLRPLAIYLPQFHPIPENDTWWGKGFTEWTNVTKAKALFNGHYQPHLPKDLGFYDLRLIESMEGQADLAKEYGIYGFCIYHYWFSGKRVLEFPVENLIEKRRPNFPFSLCWANENWTRRWDGADQEVLLSQDYSDLDDLAQIRALFKYFKDERYITVDGKPLFIVYKSHLLPNPKRTTEIWRDEAKKLGLEGLYLVRMEFNDKDLIDPTLQGFDAGIEFQPFYKIKNIQKIVNETIVDKLIRKLFTSKKSVYWENYVYRYCDLVDTNIPYENNEYKIYPGITPSWDNTSRRKSGATIFEGSNPELYGKWLSEITSGFKPFSSHENFIFINAWNEWAEGNHLEPCQKWGRSYLEVTKRILSSK